MSLMKTESPRIPDNAICASDPAESLCVSPGYSLSLDPSRSLLDPTVNDRRDDQNNRNYVCVGIYIYVRIEREREV